MATPHAVPIQPARLASAKLPFPAMPRPRPARPRAIVVAGLAIGLLGGVFALAQPSWLIHSRGAAESPEVSEASLRLAIVRERQRIEAYRVEHGELPPTLEAAGGTISGIRYAIQPDGSYVLEADHGRSYVRLSSTGSLQAFLGNSLHVILSRPTG